MSLRLPLVLTELDLPLPELLAARLDGELFTVDDAFAPLDEIEQPAHRAHAILDAAPARFIAEQHSAAWVWGVLARPPRSHEFCVDIGARVSGATARIQRVREVVIEPHEIALFGSAKVTAPLRTVVDLARFSERFGETEERAVRGLMTAAHLTVEECVDELNRRRNLPNKRQAAERIRSLAAGSSRY
jgi:hypothetical protein